MTNRKLLGLFSQISRFFLFRRLGMDIRSERFYPLEFYLVHLLVNDGIQTIPSLSICKQSNIQNNMRTLANLSSFNIVNVESNCYF